MARRMMLCTTAVAALAAAQIAPTAVRAQDQNQQQAEISGECRDLIRLARQEIDDADALQRVNELAYEDSSQQCVDIAERIREEGRAFAAASDRAQDADSATDSAEVEAVEDVDASASVDIERRAVVEGEVVVRQGAASVDVESPGPEVEVRPGQPEVNVSAGAPEITVRQRQPEIRVAMPQPDITIRMPAPEIFVRMPEPNVDVSSAEPQVDVRQRDPEVSVQVPDPEVNVDVQARIVDPDEVDVEEMRQGDGEGGLARVERDDSEPEINVSRGEPQVTMAEAGDQGGSRNVTVNRGEPRITYEPAEPNVRIVNQPNVKFEQVGEPKVTFETAEQRDQRRRQEQQQASARDQQNRSQQQASMQDEDEGQRQAAMSSDGQDGQTQERQASSQRSKQQSGQQQASIGGDDADRERLTASDPSLDNGQLSQVAVGDIEDAEVENARGEELGDVERIVRNGGDTYVIVSHGGFLGIGDEEVALPITRLRLRNETLVLQGLSEEEFEEMPEYDFSAEDELMGDDTVEISRL